MHARRLVTRQADNGARPADYAFGKAVACARAQNNAPRASLPSLRHRPSQSSRLLLPSFGKRTKRARSRGPRESKLPRRPLGAHHQMNYLRLRALSLPRQAINKEGADIVTSIECVSSSGSGSLVATADTIASIWPVVPWLPTNNSNNICNRTDPRGKRQKQECQTPEDNLEKPPRIPPQLSSFEEGRQLVIREQKKKAA